MKKKSRKRKSTARSATQDRKKVAKKKSVRRAKHKEGDQKKMFGTVYVFRAGKFTPTKKSGDDQGDYDDLKTEKSTPDRKRTQARARKKKQRTREKRAQVVITDIKNIENDYGAFII